MALTTIQLLNYSAWMPGMLGELGSTWVKWLQPPAGVGAFPGIKLDVRIWTDDRDRAYIEAGEAGGRQFVRDMMACWRQWPWATCYELANEPPCNGNSDLANLRLYTIGAMREANAQGIKLCILNVAEGNPSGPDDAIRWKWEQLVEAIKLAGELGHYVGLHLYWRPGVEGPLGRYHALGRRVWDVQQWAAMGLDLARLQLLVTECGIDGGIASGPAGKGWRSLSNAAAYTADIVQLEQEARQYPWLKSLMYFIAQHPGWQDFDMTEPLVRGLVAPIRAIVDVQPPAVTTPATIMRGFTPVEFSDYVRDVAVIEPFDRVCIHHTVRPTLAQWQEHGGEYWLKAMLAVYKARGWTRFPHVFAGPDRIWVMGALELDGAGVAGRNAGVRHVEIVGDYSASLPVGTTLEHAVSAAATLLCKAGRGIEYLTNHNIMQLGYPCPGETLLSKWGWFKALVAGVLAPTPVPEKTIGDARWESEEATRALEMLQYERCHALLLELTRTLYQLEAAARG